MRPHRRPGVRAGARGLGAGAGAVALAVALVPLALLVRAEWPPLVDLDEATTDAAEDAVRSSAALLAAARAVTLLGDPALVWVASLLLAAVLAARGRARPALLVLAVRLGTQVLSSSLKAALDRARPVFDVPVDAAAGGSWPSGHTLSAAGFWTALAVLALPHVRRGRRVAVLAAGVAVAALVGASRVLLGVHHLSDVVGGLLLGVGWTAVCTAVLVRYAVEEGERVDTVSGALEEDR